MKKSRKTEEAHGIGSLLLLDLPEACVSHAISLTTPGDACRCSAVSRAFQAAADLDAVWERFLPTDYSSILARADDPVDLSSTKKDLFRSLVQEHVLLDKGTKSFSLDKIRGGKCYMLSSRSLGIAWGWGNHPIHWRFLSLADSRFEQVAELLSVCWLHITGKIGSRELSPSTTYSAYLVFKLADDSYGLDSLTQEASITVGDNNVSKRIVSLYPRKQESQSSTSSTSTDEQHNAEEQGECRTRSYPRQRADGWLEVEMGQFYNDQGEDGEVTILFTEIVEQHWKKGLILEGIEIRPKHTP
ncbi:F-box protein PP2-B10-like [Oryza brachyantha]|uniref:F-box domain-containing protein n=1 Tax=Oryza brachyantha TaxID=4533 RepID=J3NB36_ORYBR|nr:F-box protein PP2-B10-like [Oryza brachyantha]